MDNSIFRKLPRPNFMGAIGGGLFFLLFWFANRSDVLNSELVLFLCSPVMTLLGSNLKNEPLNWFSYLVYFSLLGYVIGCCIMIKTFWKWIILFCLLILLFFLHWYIYGQLSII